MECLLFLLQVISTSNNGSSTIYNYVTVYILLYTSVLVFIFSVHVVSPQNVSLTTTVSGPLVEGQFLDLICMINTSQFDTFAVTWSRNETELTNGSDYTICSVANSSNIYISVLHINSLYYYRDNNAIYSCSVDISSSPSFTDSIRIVVYSTLSVARKIHLYIVSLVL